MTDNRLFVGLLSGTSRDGVDAVVADLAGDNPRLIEALCLPYPDTIAKALMRMVSSGIRPEQQAMRDIDQRLADVFADAVARLLEQADLAHHEITAIGSHGQTVWHDPDATLPETIQLGDPQRLAQLTGIPTVGDFRQADLLAGGQGAPLAPLLHRELFRPESGQRAVINLGGIANVSVLHGNGQVRGYDTGPANCLMDGWVLEHKGKPYDDDGRWAASGNVCPALLQAMLKDDYFAKPAPKSTGIEYFNALWLEQYLSRCTASGAALDSADVQATLCELTARTLAASLANEEIEDILVCGGGSHNSFLLERIQQRVECPLSSTAAHGLDPDWVEAVLFAWLAQAHLDDKAQDTRAITGAAHPVLLGQKFNP